MENPTKSVGFSDEDRVRFWSKVDRTETCWLWLGSQLGSCGAGSKYGGFSVARGKPRGKQAPHYAHRVAFELTFGPIPKGLHVCHRCDVPLCVNPGHLFLGTHRENMEDASRKGRLHVPRRRHQRLNDSQIAEIIALRQAGFTLVNIADRYDVSKAFVSLVARGQRRKYSPRVAA